MSQRRKGRELALQMLYQSELGASSLAQIVADFRPNGYSDDDAPEEEGGGADRADRISQSRSPAGERAIDYGRALAAGTLAHEGEIDQLIQQQADHWRLERMPAVDRNILRLAVYEFMYQADVPKLVVINEAIELAKSYGSEESSRFINGLLDGLLKAHDFPGRLT